VPELEPRPDHASYLASWLEVLANEKRFIFAAAAHAQRAVAIVNLSETGDLREAAAGLFAALQRLDASGAATIAVEPVPARGLGEAINDRLRRAAAPREMEEGHA